MRADFSAIMPLMDWEHASDVANDLKEILKRINMPHVDLKRVIAFRSYGSSSRARARIWSFPKIWQQALNLPAHYVLEVLSEKYDRLSPDPHLGRSGRENVSPDGLDRALCPGRITPVGVDPDAGAGLPCSEGAHR